MDKISTTPLYCTRRIWNILASIRPNGYIIWQSIFLETQLQSIVATESMASQITIGCDPHKDQPMEETTSTMARQRERERSSRLRRYLVGRTRMYSGSSSKAMRPLLKERMNATKRFMYLIYQWRKQQSNRLVLNLERRTTVKKFCF